MFFRNLTLFRIPASVCEGLADQAALEASLSGHALRDCGPLEMQSHGFVSPHGRTGTELTHRVGDFTLIALGQQAKILPSAVVAEFLAERIAEVQEREDRRVGARERKRLKEAVTTELLARAFIRPSRVQAYIDHVQGWLVIDTASRKVAEDVVTALREALGTLPVMPMAPEESPRACLTGWLVKDDPPAPLTWGDECDLRDPIEAGATVTCRRQDMATDEVRDHLKAGKQVFRAGFDFDERMTLVLGEDLTVRKLRFLDTVLDEIGEGATESARAELDARFALMTLELRRLLAWIDETFGVPQSESPGLALEPPPTPKCMRDPIRNERTEKFANEFASHAKNAGLNVSVSFGPYTDLAKVLNAQTDLPPDVEHWLRHGERGMSSETLCAHFLGVLPDGACNHPLDPGDLKRCRKLLEAVPEFAARLSEAAAISPIWGNLIGEWGDLCALMDAEAPEWRAGRGAANQTYERMTALGA